MKVQERSAILIDAENVMANEAGWQVRFESLVSDLLYFWGPRTSLQVFVGDRAPQEMLNRARGVAANHIAVHVVPRSVDVALAIAGTQLLPAVDTLVLVSCDADLLPLLQAARGSGKDSVLVTAPRLAPAAMAVSAHSALAPADLLPRSPEGIIEPGAGSDVTRAIVLHFRRCTGRVVVIDPYTNKETLRMMTFGASSRELVVVTRLLDEETRREAQEAITEGARLAIYRSKQLHDRFFAVDDEWYQSGTSIKDLGRQWTRISKISDRAEILQLESMLRRLASPINLAIK